jgi:hypothetical protein
VIFSVARVEGNTTFFSYSYPTAGMDKISYPNMVIYRCECVK